jgi:hypothetical protein
MNIEWIAVISMLKLAVPLTGKRRNIFVISRDITCVASAFDVANRGISCVSTIRHTCVICAGLSPYGILDLLYGPLEMS